MARKTNGWAMNPHNYYYPSINGSSGLSIITVLLFIMCFALLTMAGTMLATGQVIGGTLAALGFMIAVTFGYLDFNGKLGTRNKVKLHNFMDQNVIDELVPHAATLDGGEEQLLHADLWHYLHHLNSKAEKPLDLGDNSWDHLFSTPAPDPDAAVRGWCGTAPTEAFSKAHKMLRNLAPELQWPSQATNVKWVNGKPLWTLTDGTVVYADFTSTIVDSTGRPVQANIMSASSVMLKFEDHIKKKLEGGGGANFTLNYGTNAVIRQYHTETEIAALNASQHELASATKRYEKVKEAWTTLITDPLNALTHCSLFSNDDAITDAFVKSFFKLEDAIEAGKSGGVMLESIGDLAIETERKWETALTSAQRKSYTWLPPKQAADGMLAEKLLILANNAGATKDERINAARKAANILESMDSVVFPSETSVHLELMSTKMKELAI